MKVTNPEEAIAFLMFGDAFANFNPLKQQEVLTLCAARLHRLEALFGYTITKMEKK